jgi:hypothetical protein
MDRGRYVMATELEQTILGIHAIALALASKELARRSGFTSVEWIRLFLTEARRSADRATPEEFENYVNVLLIAAQSPDESA